MEQDKCFRYLEKYVGKYRVLADLNPDTEDFPRDAEGKIPDTFEDLYIACGKGEIRHTYEPGILCWRILDKPRTGYNVYEELKSKKLKVEFDDCGSDVQIFFDEADLDKVAKVVRARTAGAKIKPFSPKNLPRAQYKIPEEDLEQLSNLLSDLDRKVRLRIGRDSLKLFDTIIAKKKGKKFNVEEERDNSGLKPKEFIHSIGLWNEYCKFVKKQIKEVK